MTDLATAPARHRSAPIAEPRARFTDLIAAEWIKLWSLRSTAWVFLISALAIIAFNINAAYADYNNWPGYNEEVRANFIPGWAAFDAFTSTASNALMLAVGAIGAIAIVGEYSTGLIRTTFAAVPNRRSVMMAKVVVVTVVTTLFGGVVAGGSFWLTQAVLSGQHIGLSIAYPGAWRIVAASALLAPVSALVGMGIGALVRHSATTIVATTVILLLVPTALSDNRYVTAVIAHTMPHSAWGRLIQIAQGTGPWQKTNYPWTAGGAWTVYAAWALGGALLAILSVQRRDQ